MFSCVPFLPLPATSAISASEVGSGKAESLPEPEATQRDSVDLCSSSSSESFDKDLVCVENLHPMSCTDPPSPTESEKADRKAAEARPGTQRNWRLKTDLNHDEQLVREITANTSRKLFDENPSGSEECDDDTKPRDEIGTFKDPCMHKQLIIFKY